MFDLFPVTGKIESGTVTLDMTFRAGFFRITAPAEFRILRVFFTGAMADLALDVN